MYRLVRAESGESFDLPLGRAVVVGRGADADITVADPTLSRRHASLKRSWDQKVTVEDLGSSNGTCINGVRVKTGTLSSGDTITFGKIKFRLETAGVADAQTSADATVLRHRTVRPRASIVDAAAEGTTVIRARTAPDEAELTQRKLSLLLDVSTALSRVEDIDV